MHFKECFHIPPAQILATEMLLILIQWYQAFYFLKSQKGVKQSQEIHLALSSQIPFAPPPDELSTPVNSFTVIIHQIITDAQRCLFFHQKYKRFFICYKYANLTSSPLSSKMNIIKRLGFPKKGRIHFKTSF